MERVDLFGRLHLSAGNVTREVHRLIPRLERSGIKYHKEGLEQLKNLVETGEIDYYKVVYEVEHLLEVS